MSGSKFKDPAFQRQIKHKWIYDKIFFDSQLEIKAYIWLRDHQCQFKVHPDKAFEYEARGKKHFYCPDFEVNGHLVELKGAHFFSKDGKMRNPYDSTQDDIYQAKQKCMSENNIVVIRSDSICSKAWDSYVNRHYGRGHLKGCKHSEAIEFKQQQSESQDLDLSQVCEKLKALVVAHPNSYSRTLKKTENRQLLNSALKLVPLLQSDEYSWKTRIYWILNNVTTFTDPRCCCHNCGKDGEHRNVKRLSVGYHDHCCDKCAKESKQRKERCEATCIKHFGVKNGSQAQEVKDKKAKTNISRRGVENPMQDFNIRSKVIKTTLERYGVEFPLQSSSVKSQQENTMMKRYGAALPWDVPEIRAKALKNLLPKLDEIHQLGRQQYTYLGHSFDSKLEVAYFIYQQDLGNELIPHPAEYFTYLSHGKELKYYPDFYSKKLKCYVELKGAQFFKEDGTMYCPFRSPEMSDAEYELLCETYAAKQKCMFENNVLVVRSDSSEAKAAFEHIDKTYGKKFLSSLKC